MKVKTPQAPAPDPSLAAIQANTEQNNLNAIQKSTQRETNLIARLFGSASNMSGSSMKAPILGL